MQSMIVTALSFPENFFNNFKRKYQKQVNAPSMTKSAPVVKVLVSPAR